MPRPLLALLAAILVAFGVSYFSDRIDPYFLDVMTGVGINIILAVSLNLVNGYTGQFSLGHAGFMSVGAYLSAAITLLLGLVVIEVEGRLDVDLDGMELHLVGAPGSGPDTSSDGAAAATRAEVRAALSGLGYGADEVRHALSRLPAEGELEDHIRLALRELAGAR